MIERAALEAYVRLVMKRLFLILPFALTAFATGTGHAQERSVTADLATEKVDALGTFYLFDTL